MSLSSLDALAAATPASRNRYVDFLRALAILVVACGHWLLAAVVVRDGQLIPNALLNIASWTHPLTWVFQVMPIFFFVGGYANALSWRSARARGGSYAGWLRARILRLGTPVVPLLLVWLVICTAAYLGGVSPTTLRTASQVALVPTWFLAAYVLVVATTPWALALWERFGWWAIAAGLALGALNDAISLGAGPFGEGVFAVGFLNYLVVWGVVHQLGFAWRDGRLDGAGRRAAVAAIGFVVLGILVWLLPYPVSMIGVDTIAVNNSYPTRVTLGFLGLGQAGVLLLAEPWAQRWLQRERPWKATILVNARIMTLYLWHLTAMLLVIGLLLLMGGLGLHAEPLTGMWWALRPLWYALLIGVTIGFIRIWGRIESIPRDDRPPPPLWRPLLATVLLCGGLGVMAAQGIVSSVGLRWWWPLLPIAGVALLGRPTSSHASTKGG